ncbi:hypothetical protein LUZ60_011175 [Juncus effusus]|nr:hypothetical protein LUZ60_011175 [Juncus effusus]
MLAFRASSTLLRNSGLLSGNPRAGAFLVIRKIGGMKPQVRCSSSSGSVSQARVTKKAAKLNDESFDSAVKEVAIEGNAEMEFIRTDPDKLQKLTVKELRELTKKVGVSTKGTKKDLVSALLSSIDETQNGQSPSKRKEISSSTIEHTLECSTIISENQTKQKKSKIKQKTVKTETLEGNSVINTIQQTLVEPWTVLTHKKPKPDWIAYNPRSTRPPPLSRDNCKFVKFLSWNVNGLRALLKSKNFSAIELAEREDFDVLCLQETKIQEKDIEEVRESLIEGYKNNYWTCSLTKLGYSGTAIISRIKPISVSYGLGVTDHDGEGRLLTVEFEGFYLLSSYVPNSGDGLKRLNYRVTEWDPSLSNYMKELEKSKPVILTGDLNCAHQEIDIYNPAGNKRSAGFTIEERQSFEKCYLNNGFIDTFRKQNPNVVAYSYWGYRHGGRKTNKGWRLDYFLVSESLMGKVYDSYILPDIGGSDHCPVGLILKI